MFRSDLVVGCQQGSYQPNWQLSCWYCPAQQHRRNKLHIYDARLRARSSLAPGLAKVT